MSRFRALWGAHLRLIATRQLDVMIFVLYFAILGPTAVAARLLRHRALGAELVAPNWIRRHGRPTAAALRRMS